MDNTLNHIHSTISNMDRTLNHIDSTLKRIDGSMAPELVSEKKMYDSVESRLFCLNYENLGVCSVSFVPEKIRRTKVEVYIPQVVSIGPLHKRTSNNLLFMEEIKLRCLSYLFSRASSSIKKPLQNCISTLIMIDEVVRASYNVVDIKFNSEELSMIMLLDLCFLLELLISASPELNEKLKSNSNNTSPGVQIIIKGEKVLSDLIILENQIPLVVLYDLFMAIFGDDFPGIDYDYTRISLQKAALSMLGYGTPGSNSSRSKFAASHFLELVHSFIDQEKYEHAVGEENNQVRIPVRSAGQVNSTHGKQKLKRCATRLEAAGVAIQPSQGSDTRFDLKVKFSQGKLEIPQLHITETTEAKWRNFIAYEVTNILAQNNGRRALSDIMGVDNGAGNSCQFICYAWFFQSLICCVHDVKLLRKRQVIVVHEEDKEGRKNPMSDEDLMKLFHKLTEGVSECDAKIDMDPWIGDVIQKLNSHTDPRLQHWPMKTGKIMWHVLRWFISWIWYSTRDSIRVLIRDYIPTGWRLIAVLAAAAGLALTAAQTVYSARGG